MGPMWMHENQVLKQESLEECIFQSKTKIYNQAALHPANTDLFSNKKKLKLSLRSLPLNYTAHP